MPAPLPPPPPPPNPLHPPRTSHPEVSGVTPSKVIRKQQLAEKSILYQQATTGFLHLSYMIFVVKASEHPSPPLVSSLSSVAKTIRRKGRVDEGRRRRWWWREKRQKERGKGGGRGEIVPGVRRLAAGGGICCSAAFSLICI